MQAIVNTGNCCGFQLWLGTGLSLCLCLYNMNFPSCMSNLLIWQKTVPKLGWTLQTFNTYSRAHESFACLAQYICAKSLGRSARKTDANDIFIAFSFCKLLSCLQILQICTLCVQGLTMDLWLPVQVPTSSTTIMLWYTADITFEDTWISCCRCYLLSTPFSFSLFLSAGVSEGSVLRKNLFQTKHRSA